METHCWSCTNVVEGVLQCVAVCRSVLQCVAVCHSALQCVVACCSMLQYAAACCSVLQRVAVCGAVCSSVSPFLDRSPIMCNSITIIWMNCFCELQLLQFTQAEWCCSCFWECVAVCCSVCCSALQCAAVCCNVLQCVRDFLSHSLSLDLSLVCACSLSFPISHCFSRLSFDSIDFKYACMHACLSMCVRTHVSACLWFKSQ